jgi:hypothetical protein
LRVSSSRQGESVRNSSPADWFTAKRPSATVAVPLRGAPVSFAAHVTVTVPEPVDESGVTESQVAAFEEALQEPSWQPGGFPVTVSRVEPAAAPGAIEVGVMEKLVQGGADCITAKVLPAMVAVPVRDSSAAF